MRYNIIADVAGRYNELMKLVSLMPKADKIILVGDLVDRGPNSKEVVEWAMNTSNVIALKGNHEDMMINAYDRDDQDHLYNGGKATLKSYGITKATNYPPEHIVWMRSLPVFFQDEGVFVSHAPWDGVLGEYEHELDALWNRFPPTKVDGVFQVYGHNSSMKAYGDYAMCIDNCCGKELCGMSWPDKKIYTVAYEE